ncbi:hypothetical protein [Streptomyces sp. HPF1205]|nr:hypothetical protein [Streptomyces sp. HPF1205]
MGRGFLTRYDTTPESYLPDSSASAQGPRSSWRQSPEAMSAMMRRQPLVR